MLGNIKSKPNFQEVFSFLSEKRLLKLVIYNKQFQNKLEKRLIDYKIMSGKYIIYEGTNQGKICDDISHKLIFEGGLLKGKKMEKEKNTTLMVI